MKKLLMTLLMLIITALPAFAAPTNTSGPWGVLVSKGSGYTSLVSALSSPTTAGKTVVIASPMTVSVDFVLPADRHIKFIRGGRIDPATGKTFDFNGQAPDAGSYQIFSGTGTISGLISSQPYWFDTSNISDGINKAIAATRPGGSVDISMIGDVSFQSTVTLNNQVQLLLGGGTITGPSSGYIFDVNTNDCKIIGRGGKLKVVAGGTGGIRNNEGMRTNISNIKIDLNNVAGVIGLYHSGGWYNNYQDIEIEKAKTHSTSTGVKINSTDGYGGVNGVAGPTGSYGGSYIGYYKNIVAKNVVITATLPNKTTTQTFANLDTEAVVATNALSLTFLQPILQVTANDTTMFTLNNVAGFTSIGGDLESYSYTGVKVYSFSGSTRGVHSLNNTLSGSSMTYLTGSPTAGSYFSDDFTSTVSGSFRGYIGSAEDLTLGNANTANKHHLGTQYNADVLVLSNNLKLLSDTQANLDDVSKNGFALTMNTSAQLKLRFAYAGANPRTLTEVALIDNGGMSVFGVPSYVSNAAALAGGLTAGRLYRNGDALNIVH